MKREQLKKLIKPIIKECIHEVIIESGVLSNIVTEIANGMNAAHPTQHIVSEQQTKTTQQAPNSQQSLVREKMNEARKRLTKSMGSKTYSNLFEGVTPTTAEPQAGALSDVDPADPGVDISGIVALGGKKWKSFTS